MQRRPELCGLPAGHSTVSRWKLRPVTGAVHTLQHCRIVNSFDDFLILRQQWNELVVKTGVDHAFMKHEWFAEWIKAFGVRRTLAVVTIWSEGQLTAIAPLYRKDFHMRGLKVSGFGFLSSNISPRCNFIAAEASALDQLFEETLNLPDWNMLVTDNMEAEETTTRQYLEFLDAESRRNNVEVVDGRQSPYMMVKGDWEDYWQSLSSSRRYYFNRHQKKLEKAGSHEVIHITDAAQFQKFLPTMYEISQKSWKGDVGTHLDTDSSEGKMYAGFTPVGLENDWVTLSALRIEDRIVGFDYFLKCGNRHSLIRTDYDTEFKRFSPGNMLKLHTLQNIFKENVVGEFDLGGDPAPYKQDWCDRIRKHITVTVGNTGLKGQAVMFARKTLMPAIRKFTESSTQETTGK